MPVAGGRVKPPTRASCVALAHRALENGGRVESPGRISWNVAGPCQAPVERRVEPRKEEILGQWIETTGSTYITNDAGYGWWHHFRSGTMTVPLEHVEPRGPLAITLTVPCRKCDACRRRRAAEWAARARAEIETASRTWFGTLTFRPDRMTYHEYRSHVDYRDRFGQPALEAEGLPKQFAEWNRSAGREVTLMLKRLRKAGERFRYLLVMEAHNKAGVSFPHYHLLLHEIDAARPVRHAVLSRAWPEGFSKWKLVDRADGKAAWYVCKYLAKASAARVRSSGRYGATEDHEGVIDRILKDRKETNATSSDYARPAERPHRPLTTTPPTVGSETEVEDIPF